MDIFGYTWDEIKRAQQGGALARRIPAGICKPLATEGDWELLERYGEAFLDMINDPVNPLTNSDLKRLIERNPERYGMYSGFLGKLKD